MAYADKCKISCTNFFAFSPKHTSTVTKLLRVEIIKAGEKKSKPVKKKPRHWSKEELR